jgi:hypothetical protein
MQKITDYAADCAVAAASTRRPRSAFGSLLGDYFISAFCLVGATRRATTRRRRAEYDSGDGEINLNLPTPCQ